MRAVERMPQRTYPHEPSLIGRNVVVISRMLRGRVSANSDDLGDVVGAHHPLELGHVLAAPRADREVRRDAAGADVRAAHAVLAQLDVERPHEADLAELRRVVDRLARERVDAGDRRERDEVPAAVGRDEVRQRGPRRVQHALEVDVDHELELLGIELEKRPVGADAGVGDDDVQAPVRRDGRRHERIDLRGIADVGGGRHRARDPEVVAAARAEPERDAGVGQPARNRGTDAAAGAGDERDLPVRPSVAPVTLCPIARDLGARSSRRRRRAAARGR